MKYFLKKSLCLYFRKKEPWKNFFVFQKVTFRARKCFLFFKKWNFSISSLKTLVLFLGEPLRVFHHCFFRCFISPLIINIVFGCFHCWLHWFTSLFLLCHDFFLSGTSFLSCYTMKATDLTVFYSQSFFTLHSFPTFGVISMTCFYQDFPGHKQFCFEGYRRPPTEVRNRNPAHLFVWITQYSAKGISR